MAGKKTSPPPMPMAVDGGGQDEVGAAWRQGTSDRGGRTVGAGGDAMRVRVRVRVRRRDGEEPPAGRRRGRAVT